ncbi:MAG TPA: hypothetical protein VH186_10635 [Chloroflexia bacterium]|nr:hypothetical protein [Chloroflexia bacterium]
MFYQTRSIKTLWRAGLLWLAAGLGLLTLNACGSDATPTPGIVPTPVAANSTPARPDIPLISGLVDPSQAVTQTPAATAGASVVASSTGPTTELAAPAFSPTPAATAPAATAVSSTLPASPAAPTFTVAASLPLPTAKPGLSDAPAKSLKLLSSTPPQTGHTNTINRLAISKDGKLLASASDDRTVKLWEIQQGIPKLRSTLIGHLSFVLSVAISPDGKLVASGGEDKLLKIWDTASGKVLKTFPEQEEGVGALTFSPDGKYLASGNYDEVLRIYEVATGLEIQKVEINKQSNGEIVTLAYSPDGKLLAAGGGNGTIPLLRLFDPASLKTVADFSGHTGEVFSLAFSADGKRLVSASGDKTARVWEVASAKELFRLNGHTDRLYSAAFNPDGQSIVSSSKDGSLRKWDAASGRQLVNTSDNQQYSGLKGTTQSLVYSPDGTELYGAYEKIPEFGISIVNAQTLKRQDLVKGAFSSIGIGGFSPDGQTLATVVGGKTVNLWQGFPGSPKVSGSLKIPEGYHKSSKIDCLAYSPDGKKLAAGLSDGGALVWNLKNEQDFFSISEAHQYDVNTVAFSPDGKLLALGGKDELITIWDLATQQELHILGDNSAHQGNEVFSVEFSPDGKFLAAGYFGSILRLWDVTSGNLIRSAEGAGAGGIIDLSPDGKFLASAHAIPDEIHLWDVSSMKQLKTFKGHTSLITALIYSPNGKSLFSASQDGTIKIWNVAGGEEAVYTSELSQTLGVHGLALSPDGKLLASVQNNDALKFWQVE